MGRPNNQNQPSKPAWVHLRSFVRRWSQHKHMISHITINQNIQLQRYHSPYRWMHLHIYRVRRWSQYSQIIRCGNGYSTSTVYIHRHNTQSAALVAVLSNPYTECGVGRSALKSLGALMGTAPLLYTSIHRVRRWSQYSQIIWCGNGYSTSFVYSHNHVFYD